MIKKTAKEVGFIGKTFAAEYQNPVRELVPDTDGVEQERALPGAAQVPAARRAAAAAGRVAAAGARARAAQPPVPPAHLAGGRRAGPGGRAALHTVQGEGSVVTDHVYVHIISW